MTVYVRISTRVYSANKITCNQNKSSLINLFIYLSKELGARDTPHHHLCCRFKRHQRRDSSANVLLLMPFARQRKELFTFNYKVILVGYLTSFCAFLSFSVSLFVCLLFTLSQCRIFPAAITTQMPLGPMPVGGAQTLEQNTRQMVG